LILLFLLLLDCWILLFRRGGDTSQINKNNKNIKDENLDDDNKQR